VAAGIFFFRAVAGLEMVFVMDAGRKSLPHEVPLWVDAGRSVFFVTCCAEDRTAKPFSCTETARGLLDSISHRVELEQWRVHAATIMPDHAHLVLGFPEEGVVGKAVRDWKRWTARVLGFRWQRDFFEHRLRHDESFQEKCRYVLENPVRAGLVEDWRDWPYTIVEGDETPLRG
jgi:REP element-mobilizing transposase RayT